MKTPKVPAATPAADNGEAPSAHLQARILAEAIPHLIRYDEQTVVIKFGGHAMGDEALADAFAQDIVYLKQSGVNPIVVHGGGPQIADMLKKLEIASDFVHGLRVTDKATVEIVEMVLAGKINKEIVSAINRQGGKAVGISGKDANLMIAKKITELPDPKTNKMLAVDLGFVGDPQEVNPHIVEVLSKSDLIPVIAPVGISRSGETLNINADSFASALAARMQAKRLLLLTDVAGVLDGNKKLIERLTTDESRKSRVASKSSKPASKRWSSSTAGCRIACCSNSLPSTASAPSSAAPNAKRPRRDRVLKGQCGTRLRPRPHLDF